MINDRNSDPSNSYVDHAAQAADDAEPAIPAGLTRVVRPPLTAEDEALVRSLIADLTKGPEARAKAAAALIDLDYKAAGILEELRRTASYPLSKFIEDVLSEMPLSAFARNGEFIRETDSMVMVWVPPFSRRTTTS